MDIGAADGLGQAAVLVLGVDHRDLDPRVEGPQRFELGQVATCRRRERARMTELWLSWAKRSHSTSPEPFVAVP